MALPPCGILKRRKVTMPKITFEGRSPLTLDYPQPEPASRAIPDWWKAAPVYIGDDKFTMQGLMKFGGGSAPNVGVKRCLPVLDGLSAGYIIRLHCDVEFSYRYNEKPHEYMHQEPFYSSQNSPVSKWSKEQFNGYNIPDGYSRQVYKWNANWMVRTPPGYSCLFIHPIGYGDLPFKSLSGVVDTDKLETDINTPFIIKSDFQGIIEKGTPIAQIIPFRREEWTSEVTLLTEEEQRRRLERLTSKIVSSYGRHYRKPKVYK